MVRSKSALVAPIPRAIAPIWMISAAWLPTMWQPSTRSVLASTTSLSKQQGATLWQGLMHVAEAGFVDGDGLSAKLFFGSFFAEANAGQFWLGEHRCGDQVMVHRAAAIGEEGIGNGPALIDGHGVKLMRSVTSPTA